MIPELHIAKLERGTYEARQLDGDQELAEATLHESIADALRDVGQRISKAWADFVNVTYFDVSIRTQPLKKLAEHSEALANQLVALAAAVWQAEEERASRSGSP